MIIALIGSHGTGKTSVCKVLKKKKPEYAYFTEGVRHQVLKFGYKDPFQIAEKFGIGAFELMNVNSWSVIDSDANTLLAKNRTVITDRSALDNYAYFLALKKAPDKKVAELVKRMCKHYAGLVDKFIYFPVGAITLKGDDMRPEDADFQKKVDQCIRKAIRELGVNKNKVYVIKKGSPEMRTEEVMRIISGK